MVGCKAQYFLLPSLLASPWWPAEQATGFSFLLLRHGTRRNNPRQLRKRTDNHHFSFFFAPLLRDPPFQGCVREPRRSSDGLDIEKKGRKERRLATRETELCCRAETASKKPLHFRKSVCPTSRFLISVAKRGRAFAIQGCPSLRRTTRCGSPHGCQCRQAVRREAFGVARTNEAEMGPSLEANMQVLTIDTETALIPRKSKRGRRFYLDN